MTEDSFSPSKPYGLERQFQIYLEGLQGKRPSLPVSLEVLEQQANSTMTPEARGYISGGAGSEDSLRANRAAFQRWFIVPRMLRNVSQRDLSVHILKMQLPFPILLAPIGVQSIADKEGELAVARAAASTMMPLILSTASSYTIEEIAQTMGETQRWFQLYWSKNPELNASWISRAEKAGYSAIVVTLDTNLLSWREQDIQHAYLPFLLGQGLANYFSDPVFRAGLSEPIEQNPQAAIFHFTTLFSNPALTWNDLSFLRQRTQLPILLKGILHPEDALKALEYGIDGIIVSNHGGRQVDGVQPALDALPDVVTAIQGRIPILFDSGIRRGADVLKAIALGAKAVLLGRPYMWGLALAGEEGVRDVILNLLADLDLTLALSGCTSVRDLDASLLTRALP